MSGIGGVGGGSSFNFADYYDTSGSSDGGGDYASFLTSLPAGGSSGNGGGSNAVTGPYGTGIKTPSGALQPASAFLPASISDPNTGRVSSNAQLSFITFFGKSEQTGTPAQLLASLNNLYSANASLENSN